MKRISLMALAVIALAIAGCSSYNPLGGATPQFGETHAFTSNQGTCIGTTPFGNAELCYDKTNLMAPYANNGGVFGHANAGAHIVSAGGTAPTSGTGTVTAGGTDAAMEVTGGTSPVTVTFGRAFTVQPICVCTDETSATGVCKAVPNSNGATVVVTTASTDSFNMICLTSK